MKYFSTFSGVEGFGQGFPKDWECVGFSEVDKYASMVLKYHFPNVKNYGDISRIKWEEVADFDILTGGSPCQDFSIAGKRRGLTGSRSSLAWEYIRCLRTKKPRYFIWENVKGVMSSRSGWDFANILSAFSESGYSLWWQVLNAKDFGVPQNRERIFVVGFREGNPKEVFFKRTHSETVSEQDGDELGEQVANTLRTNYSNGYSNETYIQVQNPGASQHYRVYGQEGLAPTLQSQSGMSSQKHPFIFAVNTKKGYDEAKEGDGINLSFPNSKTRRGRVIKNNSPTLQTNADGMVGTIHKGKIRKLMPIECERLMSWQDNWTKWGIDGKGNKVEISDSQRYKMCGNGVVSNVIKEISKLLIWKK